MARRGLHCRLHRMQAAPTHDLTSVRAAWAASQRSALRPVDGPVDPRRWTDRQQRQIGNYRILAGALDAQDGGFRAAVEVHRLAASGEAEVIFSSEQISGGYRFAALAQALRHAFDVGHQAVRLHASLEP